MFSSLSANKTASMKIFKKIFGDCISKTGSKMPRHSDSKSFGAFNFIGIVALKLDTNSHNLFMKMTQHVTSYEPNVNDNEKQKFKMKAI